MVRRLPPLNGLRAFEVSAQCLSFTRAAEELNVTPSAVSQQVKSLEEYFGVQLFKRLTRSVVLTDSGQLVLPLLQEGFDRLAEADRILRTRQDDRILAVSVAPSLGAKWLIPRLDRFRRSHPDYDVRIDATNTQANFKRDNVDIALRYGLGEYPGLISECLLKEVAAPVCSPRLQDGESPLRTPEDLRHHTLLHMQWKKESDAAPNWRMWLKSAGLTDIDPDRGPQFSMESMVMQAAVDGQGVALISTALVEEDIEAGRLVRPFPEEINQQTRFCYFLVYPQDHLQRPKVGAFRDWVKKEIAAM